MRQAILAAVVVLAALAGMWIGTAAPEPARVASADPWCVTVTPECIPVITATPEPTQEVFMTTFSPPTLFGTITGGLNSSWATARSTSTSCGTATLLARARRPSSYGVNRAFLQFDTSSIPADAILTDATLRLYVTGVLANGTAVTVVTFTWSGADLCTQAETNYDNAIAGTPVGSIAEVVDEDWNEIALDPSAVTLEGNTSLAVVETNHDLADSAPGASTTYGAYFDPSVNVPELVVTYTTGGVSLVTRRALLGVGM